MKTFETRGPLEMQLRDTMLCSIIGGILHLGQKQRLLKISPSRATSSLSCKNLHHRQHSRIFKSSSIAKSNPINRGMNNESFSHRWDGQH